MSYAVIKTGGKQYKVKSGEILKIEKLPDSKPETKIEFNEILAYGDDKSIDFATNEEITDFYAKKKKSFDNAGYIDNDFEKPKFFKKSNGFWSFFILFFIK